MTFDLDSYLRSIDRVLGPSRLGVIVTEVPLVPPGPTIVYANQAIQDLTGYRAEELVGKTPRILQGELTERSVLDRVKKDLGAGNPFQGETYNYRKDGSEYLVEWQISPIYDDHGAVVVWLATMRDVTERRRIQAAHVSSEQRFRAFGAASVDALWIREAQSLRPEYISSAYQVLFDDASSGDFGHWLELVHPEDRPQVVDQIEQAKAGRTVDLGYRIRRSSDGEVRWVHGTIFPLLDQNSRVISLGGIARDVTNSVEHTERLQTLIMELQHRTRNLIAVVRSVAEETLRRTKSLARFREQFAERLAALARVQGLLSTLRDQDRVAFDELLRSELFAHGAMEKVTLTGPVGVLLRSSAVQVLGMAIHELVTNAAKYGALGENGGHLQIAWTVTSDLFGQKWLCVRWKEFGVRIPVAQARHQGTGMGRELIEQGLPYQLGARTSFRLEADGVRCDIDLPLSTPPLPQQ